MTRPVAFLDEHQIEDQLAIRFRVTVVLSLVPAVISSIILSIFAAFGRPDVGGILVGIVFVPIIVAAWLEYSRFRRRIRLSRVIDSNANKNEAPPV